MPPPTTATCPSASGIFSSSIRCRQRISYVVSQVLTIKFITIPRMWADPAAGSFHRNFHTFSVGAHPPHLACWHTHHQSEGLDIAIHHGPGSHEGVVADACATHNCAVGTQRGALFYPRVTVLVFSGYGRAWIVDIGKHHARSAEHIVLQGHIVVDRHIILNLDIIANSHSVTHKHILTKGAAVAYHGSRTHMHPVPDATAGTNLGAFINNRRRMNYSRGFNSHQLCPSTWTLQFLQHIARCLIWNQCAFQLPEVLQGQEQGSTVS